jgi:thiamine biosynthesis lipoprotein
MRNSGGPPPLRRLILPGLFVAALFAVFFFRQPGGDPYQEWVFSGATMGTTFTVKVVVPEGDDFARERLGATISALLSRIDNAMSTYIDDSEVMAFNRHGTEAFDASDDLLDIVAEAQRVARMSGGAFDITVGPLVDAWGFGPAGATETPSDETIGGLLSVTGFEHVEVDRENGTLRKDPPEVRIDLSAIAKGFAVDRVAETLRRQPYADFMVEVGGEVRAAGRNKERRVWRIGIERPDEHGRVVQAVVPLGDCSLATSGDYRNFVIRDGRRISHTIDPRLGRPIAHNLASVSVIHANCMTADALATALEVLGPDEGMAAAETHDIPALFLVRQEDGSFEELRSPVWSALIENSGAR